MRLNLLNTPQSSILNQLQSMNQLQNNMIANGTFDLSTKQIGLIRYSQERASSNYGYKDKLAKSVNFSRRPKPVQYVGLQQKMLKNRQPKVQGQISSYNSYFQQKLHRDAKFAELTRSIGNRETVFGSVFLDKAQTFRDRVQSRGRTPERTNFSRSSSHEGMERSPSIVGGSRGLATESPEQSAERLGAKKKHVFNDEIEGVMTLTSDYRQHTAAAKHRNGSL